MLNFLLGPDMHGGSAASNGFWGRYFSGLDVVSKCAVPNPKFFSGLSS